MFDLMDDQPISDSRLPKVEEGQYPPNARTEAERYRFRLCLGIARKTLGAEMDAVVWQMSRSLYNGDLPVE